MPLTREERKLLHQKSKEPTFGSGKPDSSQGLDGDLSYRKISGSGTVQYIKQSHEWIPMSSSGTMPPLRIGSGGGGTSAGASGGISSHTLLDDLDVDTHLQYLLIDGTRDMTGDLTMSDGNGINLQEDITFTGATVENKIKFPDNLANALLIGEGTNIYLQFKSSNSSEKIQFHVDADIDGGTIDGTTIGASSHTTIKGTTIDATTDFTIDGLVITADTITNDAALTVDAAGDILLDSATDIVLDAAGGNFEFKDATVGKLTIDIDGTAGDVDINLVADGDDLVFNQRDNKEVLRLTDGVLVVFRNSYMTDYAINNKPETNGRHFATGDADYKQNYSWIGLYDRQEAGDEHDADFGNWA